MPQHRAAYKSLRKDKKRALRNTAWVSEVRTLARRLNSFIAQKNKEQARQTLALFASRIWRSVRSGALHRNTASRRISRLSKKVSALS